MQSIIYPFYKINGVCNYVFYFCLGRRSFVKIEPILELCLCPIWEYQVLFLDTFNARMNKLPLDYAWSGSIFQMKPSKVPPAWNIFLDSHKRFVTARKALLLRPIVPENAFSLGVKSLHSNKRISKEILKEIKHQWCNCPAAF